MFQFCVNGVNMAFDLRKMKLYDRGQVYKLNSSPTQVKSVDIGKQAETQ